MGAVRVKDAKIVGVWGGRGSGKSTRIKALVREERRLIVFDPIGDWAQETGYRATANLVTLLKGIKRGWSEGFRYVLTVPRGSDPRGTLEALAGALFRVQEPYFQGKDDRKIVLVVEEMATCYPEKTLGTGERNFMDLVNLGRHYGVEIIGCSQRMAEVKKNFVGNCAEHYIFRLGAAVDHTAALSVIGREYRSSLKALETHQYLHFEAGKVSSGKNILR